MHIKANNIKNFFRKVTKFGLYIPLSNVVLTYGQGKLPKSLIQRIFDTRNNKIQKHLKPIIDSVDKIDYAVAKPTRIVKDAVWVCWFQGEDELPPIVRKCYQSIKNHAGNHPVVLITVYNFKEYVKIPDFILKQYESGILKQAHFADIIRVNLLAQQGGLWLDATILMTNPIDESVFSIPFWSIKTKNVGYFVSQCRWAVFVLSAQPQSRLFSKVALCFEEFLKKSNLFIDYFMFDQFIVMLYKSDMEIKKAIDAVPFNNPNIHGLDSRLEDVYDAEKLNQLKSNTGIFKLSWKNHDNEKLNAPNSMFAHL